MPKYLRKRNNVVTEVTIKNTYRLLADAKTGKNHAQQVIRAEFTRDLVECVLCEPQFFGEKVQSLRPRAQVLIRHGKVLPDPRQRLHVTCPGEVDTLGHRLPPRHFQQAGSE